MLLNLSLGASQCKLALKIKQFRAEGIFMLMLWNLTWHSTESHPKSLYPSYRMEPVFQTVRASGGVECLYVDICGVE